MDDLPCPVGQEQPVQQNKLDRTCFGAMDVVFSIGVPRFLKFCQPFQYRDAAVQRTVFRAASGGPAVKSPVGHNLLEDSVHNRLQLFFRCFEIGGIVQEHAVHANIAVLGGGWAQPNTPIPGHVVLQNQFYGRLCDLVAWREVQIPKVELSAARKQYSSKVEKTTIFEPLCEKVPSQSPRLFRS